VIQGSTVYPFGTTEQYPDALSQEGHFYMECSNKGLCNRDDGTCECFPGYEGTACQRTSCPNACSGHGVCDNIKELAEDREDGDLSKGAYAMNGYASEHAGIGDLSGVGTQIYALWDKTFTMGCKCDPGYTGSDCSLKLCRYGIDPLFIPSNYIYSADGVIEYDWDAPHFEKAYVEILSGNTGMKGQFDLTIYDVYGEKYVLDALDYATYESGNYTSCAEIMDYFPNQNLKDTVTGGIHHQMKFKGGMVSSAYMGGQTVPFCKTLAVNQTNQLKFTQISDSGLDPAATYGIRYEFDYSRANPGYIKDLFITNLIPETQWAIAENDDAPVYGFYGIEKQGEVAEYFDHNTNFDQTSNRFMYSDNNYFQSGTHDRLSDFGVTLPGYIISAHNGSTELLLSRDVHFYVEPTNCQELHTSKGKDADKPGSEFVYRHSCKDYKTASLLIFGNEYQINATHEEWFEVEGPDVSPYLVGPEQEVYTAKSKIFRPVTNITLTEPLLFPTVGSSAVDYTNITFTWGFKASNAVLVAVPEAVTVKAKLTQRYQYVSECSGRGVCDRSSGTCQCFSGFSHDNGDTQTPVC